MSFEILNDVVIKNLHVHGVQIHPEQLQSLQYTLQSSVIPAGEWHHGFQVYISKSPSWLFEVPFLA